MNKGAQGQNEPIRVFVIPERCMGHAMCQHLAPDVFSFDEREEVSYVDNEEVSGARLEAARRAELACPEQAIVLSCDT